jgi:hypothetical protein
MKKIFSILIFAVTSFAFAELPYGFAGNLTVGYGTDFLYRGIPMAAHCSTMNLGLTHSLYTGTAYLNASSCNAMDGRNPADKTYVYGPQEDKFTLGYKFPVMENVTVDVGGIYHLYPIDELMSGAYATVGGPLIDMRREAFVGVAYKGLYINPKLYFTYDYDLLGRDFNLSGSHSYDFSKYCSGLNFELGGQLGSVDYNEALSRQNAGMRSDSYQYAQADAGFSYKLDKTSKVYTGISYGDNNNGSTTNMDGCWMWKVRLTTSF